MLLLVIKSIVITLVAATTATIAAYFSSAEFGPIVQQDAVKDALLISVFVALPIAFYIQLQSLQLSKSNQALQRANEQLEQDHKNAMEQASLDAMTNVFNRVAFVREVEVRSQTASQGVMLMLDADNFKKINDKYGHAAGDLALKRFSEVMKSNTREQDIIGRLGGEEFGIYLPEADLERGHQVAERIRKNVELVVLTTAEGISFGLTISAGASFTADLTEVEKLMRLADACLYAAKDAGRNQVIMDQTA